MRHFLNFNKGMFNPNHKLYYHNDDLNIFSMAHSIAPNGYFESIIEGKNTHIELDRRKAYTKSTIDICEVPVFFLNLIFGKGMIIAKMILTR